MAISPIDLQTLFTQIDKVGKQESAQREGSAIQQALQQAQSQQRTEARIQSVNEAQDTGEGAEGIRDRSAPHPNQDEEGQRREEDANETAEKRRDVIKDPALGRNIDVSL